MSRMDALRKVLYGGYRSTDEASLTVLERAYIPQDAHSWARSTTALTGTTMTSQSILRSICRLRGQGTSLPLRTWVTVALLGTGAPYLNQPLLRVLPDSGYRVWEWVSIDRPVGRDCCFSGDFNNNGRCDEDVDGNSTIDNLIAKPTLLPETYIRRIRPNHRTFELMARKYGDPDVTPTGPTRSNMDGGELSRPALLTDRKPLWPA